MSILWRLPIFVYTFHSNVVFRWCCCCHYDQHPILVCGTIIACVCDKIRRAIFISPLIGDPFEMLCYFDQFLCLWLASWFGASVCGSDEHCGGVDWMDVVTNDRYYFIWPEARFYHEYTSQHVSGCFYWIRPSLFAIWAPFNSNWNTIFALSRHCRRCTSRSPHKRDRRIDKPHNPRIHSHNPLTQNIINATAATVRKRGGGKQNRRQSHKAAPPQIAYVCILCAQHI